MKVFLGQPQYPGSTRPEAVLACLVYAGKKHDVEYMPVCSTGTAKGFNIAWAEALGRGERREIDYFAMLHADIVPENGWIDMLVDECERLHADIVASVVAIKDYRGLTSTGVDWQAGNPWEVRRLAMAEIMKLPETFGAEDITAAGLNPTNQPLLVNTGCWVADMRRSIWYRTDAKNQARFFFTLNDAIEKTGHGEWKPKTESEDWFFSRILAAEGGRAYATRKISLRHLGDYGYPNNSQWGQCRTDESRPGMIHEHGYWTVPTEILHKHDAGLARALCEMFAAGTSVIDFGCGRGDYVLALHRAGISARGYDGNPYTEEMTGGICECADLAQPLSLSPADWVLSLEVAEHIPKQFEVAYLDNLHRHNRQGIILSWAIPGQAGTGHFNEQSVEYVTEKMVSLGYRQDIERAEVLRHASTLPWFRTNLCVFRRAQ